MVLFFLGNEDLFKFNCVYEMKLSNAMESSEYLWTYAWLEMLHEDTWKAAYEWHLEVNDVILRIFQIVFVSFLLNFNWTFLEFSNRNCK